MILSEMQRSQSSSAETLVRRDRLRTKEQESKHGCTGGQGACCTLEKFVLHVWVPLAVLLAVHVPRANGVLKVLHML